MIHALMLHQIYVQLLFIFFGNFPVHFILCSMIKLPHHATPKPVGPPTDVLIRQIIKNPIIGCVGYFMTISVSNHFFFFFDPLGNLLCP